MNIPTITIEVNLNKNVQSISELRASPKRNPNSDLTVTIIKEVPIAFLISIPPKNIKAGMMRKPPPAPTNPVTAPIRNPSKNTIAVSYTHLTLPTILLV